MSTKNVEMMDAICDHDRKRLQHCADSEHQWMALLSRAYCCEDADTENCYWRSLLLQYEDSVFSAQPMQHGGIRTGLECQHACLSNPLCKTWSYVYAPDTELSRLCFLFSVHLEDIARPAADGSASGTLQQVPGTISGRRCSCKQCEKTAPASHLIWSQLPQHSPRSSSVKADFLNSMHRHGVFVLKRAISDDLADRVLAKTKHIAAKMLAEDPFRLGNRGARRYSLGSAQKTHHLVHEPEWVELLNTQQIHDLVDALGNYLRLAPVFSKCLLRLWEDFM